MRWMQGERQMNARQELMTKIEDLSEDEKIHDVVKNFVDEMESKFSEINTLLDEVTICKLDNIEDAKDIADTVATSLY